MYALFKKEISNFLSSLIGIMVIVVFLLITGLFLWVFQSDFNLLNFGYANLDSLFILAPWTEDPDAMPRQFGGDYDRFHNMNLLAEQICAMDVARTELSFRVIG